MYVVQSVNALRFLWCISALRFVRVDGYLHSRKLFETACVAGDRGIASSLLQNQSVDTQAEFRASLNRCYGSPTHLPPMTPHLPPMTPPCVLTDLPVEPYVLKWSSFLNFQSNESDVNSFYWSAVICKVDFPEKVLGSE